MRGRAILSIPLRILRLGFNALFRREKESAPRKSKTLEEVPRDVAGCESYEEELRRSENSLAVAQRIAHVGLHNVQSS